MTAAEDTSCLVLKGRPVQMPDTNPQYFRVAKYSVYTLIIYTSALTTIITREFIPTVTMHQGRLPLPRLFFSVLCLKGIAPCVPSIQPHAGSPLSGKFDVDGSLEEPYHADAEPKDIKGGLFLALFSTVDSNETCQSLLYLIYISQAEDSSFFLTLGLTHAVPL